MATNGNGPGRIGPPTMSSGQVLQEFFDVLGKDTPFENCVSVEKFHVFVKLINKGLKIASSQTDLELDQLPEIVRSGGRINVAPKVGTIAVDYFDESK